MKTRHSATWGLGLVVAAGLAVGASAQSISNSVVRTGQIAPAKAIAGDMAVSASKTATSPSSRVVKTTPTAVSPWFTDVVKMTRAGIGPEPMLAFIDSAGTFNLTADQIVYLHSLGAPDGLITAILQHDLDLSSGVIPFPATAVPKLPPPLKTVVVTSNTPPALAATAPPAVPAAAVAPEAPGPMESDEDWSADTTTDEPAAPPGFSPVRKPYAVTLVNPIIVVRAPERWPNVISLQMPP